ncbi:MAG TPA: glycosyltransferase family 2 protein [Isosphaeraceae bacterium]|jgi:glycosyltransferase involved in cell wall biosynthesis|nr:glycosyltransferase family 2 protein [Isosphaeraceae bacterium]
MGYEARPGTLTIVIPALNEEEAIAGTVRRCLDARDEIKRAADLDDVEVIVVSDGSTDRTAEIARGFEGVEVIVFEQNRGYGAAIKEGFRRGRGSLVGFLDADGTCDPRYFAEMCRVAVEDGADVVLGSRLGPSSKMPAVRKLGNRLYALLLGLLCGRKVTDTASGMRVIRRAALPMLYPLPDRMHFTPSMSARALLGGLRVVEVPMHYEERIGESKLSVLGDGVRFLRAILEGVLCYRPERLFLMGFTACLLVGLLLAMYPLEYYLQHRRVLEWMIYRFLTCSLLGSAGFLLLCAAVLSQRMAALGPRRRDGDSFWTALAAHLFDRGALAVFVGTIVLGALALLWPGIVEFVTTGHITLHWSRVMVAMFGLLLAVQALVTKVLMKVVALWKYQEAEAPAQRDGDRRHRATAAEVIG